MKGKFLLMRHRNKRPRGNKQTKQKIKCPCCFKYVYELEENPVYNLKIEQAQGKDVAAYASVCKKCKKRIERKLRKGD